jgi:hypothetical protein
MGRRSIIAVGCTISVSLALAYPLIKLRGDTAQRAPRESIIGVAAALRLHWVGDGPQDRPQCKLILSELPIGPDRQARLNIHQAADDAWRGTVAVYVGQPRMLHLNSDPDCPERVAIWCGSFICGDPALIERLRSYAP